MDRWLLDALPSPMEGDGCNRQNQREVEATDDLISETVAPSVEKERRRGRDQEDRDELDPRDRMHGFVALSRSPTVTTICIQIVPNSSVQNPTMMQRPAMASALTFAS
jgi:hypothetical protein